jgi:hypothetical protein
MAQTEGSSHNSQLATNFSDDPFDSLLNLEEQYYKEGYEEGLKDGIESGRVEGYSLGLRKGFEKFVEAGRLQSKTIVWANRIPKYQQAQQQQQQHQDRDESTSERQEKQEDPAESADREDENRAEDEEGGSESSRSTRRRLPPIHSNPRLEKNIETLYGILEPGTLSMNNDDESVNDFDSRMKGAQGKLRIIERAIREGTNSSRATAAAVAALPSPPSKSENIEDIVTSRRPVDTKVIDI